MMVFEKHTGATQCGRASSPDLGIESRLCYLGWCVSAHKIDRIGGDGGGDASNANLVFQSQLQIPQNPAKPAPSSAKFFQRRCFDSLGSPCREWVFSTACADPRGAFSFWSNLRGDGSRVE
jgi:hypothetical protein